MGLFRAPFPLPDWPRALLHQPLPAPPPRTGSRRVFRRPGPTNDTRGLGVIPLSLRCAGSGKSFGLFYLCSSPRALSPRRPGQPRQHRHAGCPGGFSHSCGRRRHGNELIAGEWRPPEPPPARPGPAWPAGSRGCGTRSSLEGIWGEIPQFHPWPRRAPERAQLTLGCRSGEPWRPPLPSAPLLLPHSHGQHSVGSGLPPPDDASGGK